MKNLKTLSLLTLLIGSCIYLLFLKENHETPVLQNLVHAPSSIGSKESPQKRYQYELRKIVDPKTNKVPDFIHRKELEFAKKVPTREQHTRSKGVRNKTQSWTSEGPFNVGGRTRAVAIDVLDENTLIAGGVSGGIWKSNDGGISWKKTSHPATINSATCLTQDTRSGKESIWYHGTGELLGNSASTAGSAYRGDGIFTSSDNGDSWDPLPSTSNNDLSVFKSPFNYIWNIVVNNSRTDIDEIFAAVYGGIIRSQDGGLTWISVLGDDLLDIPANTDLNKSNASFFTNIIQTKSGVFYATLSAFTRTGNISNGKGIFRSTDGVNWINISPSNLTFNHKRIVMDFANSNQNMLYFFVDSDNPQLWKHTNPTTWENLSFSIPNSEEDFEGLDTQEGYNMVVKIHPEDQNIVFLGGDNFFRSTDGFTSTENTVRIGGYSAENNGNLFSGHHPDQHNLVFYPSNTKKSISSHDGGLSITNDNLAIEPSWISLNNGYVTSQFYALALSPDKGDNAIIGGMQDNGSYAKNTFIQNPPWNRVLGGDGGFCAITPNNMFWYVSFQEGRIFRLTLNDDLNLTSFAQVDPKGISREEYLFINPFVLDPNNYNRMYLAGDHEIWRNDNLSQIKSGIQETTETNWVALEESSLSNDQITALDISTNPGNIIYYATNTGNVIKVSNANQIDVSAKLIFSHPDSYPTCVSIDPSNADNLLVIYSNYNIPSIFFSNDGGITFMDVGGNLEENSDGSGNGPSIRWAEIIPLANDGYNYVVGTSVGIYSTDVLDGVNTVWLKEGNEIVGNSVVGMMDYRSSDGKLVIATHGNGIFETTISGAVEVIKQPTSAENLIVNSVYPNPFNEQVPMNINFDIPETGIVRVDILSNTGGLVRTPLFGTQFAGNNSVSWDGTNFWGTQVISGIYHYRISYRGNTIKGKIILDR